MAAPIIAAMSGVPFKQQDTTTTGNGAVLAIPPSFRNHTWIVTGASDLMMEHSGLLNFVRARISTTISGGGAPSVTVIYEGAKNY